MWSLRVSLFAAALMFYKHGAVLCSVKTWRHNVDVEDRNNWIGGAYSENCRGLIFPEGFGDACMMGVKRIVTQEIVLPKNGDVLIQDGGYISLSAKADTCIRLKQMEYRHWNHPDNWISEGEENSAVPDVERVPCEYDDVVFPAGSTFAVIYPNVAAYVNSIRINAMSVTDASWEDILYPRSDCNQFVSDGYGWIEDRRVKVLPHNCTAKGGCACQDDAEVLLDTCFNVMRNQLPRVPCFKPIRPIGHCRDFCGGVLHVTPQTDFDLLEFRRNLPPYDNVDTYASKVSQGTLEVIQIVLAERGGFDGSSIIATETLNSKLKEGLGQWKIKRVSMSVSDFPHDAKASLRNAISFIFGMLIAVVASFGLIFIGFSRLSSNKFSLASRLSLGTRLSAPASTFAFARFENRGDGGLSLAGSVLSLEKGFDNPLYGESIPSTSTSTIAEVLPAENGREAAAFTETTYENPVFFAEEKKADTSP